MKQMTTTKSSASTKSNPLTAPLRWLRSLYAWVLGWGKSKYGMWALFLIALAESSFFPIPPDVLLIALTMGAHKKWARFAVVCSIGSVLGGIIGYAIGYGAYDVVGQPMLGFIASLSGTDPDTLLQTADHWFNEKEIQGMKVGAWAVGLAGFTPIPYKVFTIAAGFFHMDFLVFVIASAISRTARFFLVAGLIGLLYDRYGDRIQVFIDKYFDWLALAFAVLLIGGFVLIGMI